MSELAIHTNRRLVGKLIKLHRKEKGLSLQDLANLLSTDRQYIWRIEKGHVNLSLDYLEKIIFQLKCTHIDFFTPLINADFHK